MKILLTGSTGQLGNEIIKACPRFINKNKVKLITPKKEEFDLTKPEICIKKIEEIKPDWVINSAAYTAVDKAESEFELALSINMNGPQIISDVISKNGGKLLHFSTDFVFSGKSSTPYKPTDEKSPINAYGLTKAKGEDQIIRKLFDTDQAIILRTSWLMGPVGNNFAKTMIRLHKERDIINVVSDQIGSPTSTINLAKACWEIIKKDSLNSLKSNILHFSDSGIASWYDVAIQIGKIGFKKSLLKKQAKVFPIPSNQYPVPARRPNFSVLDCFSTMHQFDLEFHYWVEALDAVIERF